MQDLMTWLHSGTHLPKFMRDFHDQKRLFKIIEQTVTNARAKDKDDFILKQIPSWTMAHIYTIDFFLWFMASRGWTLQRCRKPLEFRDFADDTKHFEAMELQALKEMFAEEKVKATQ